LRNHEQNKLLI